MIRNGYVRFDDEDAIHQWRRKFNNTDVFRSICVYATPSHRARFVAPMFFYVQPQGDFAAARAKTIELEEVLSCSLDVTCESVEIYFNSDGTFELFMSHEEFQPVYSPHTLAMNKEFAQFMNNDGLHLVDTRVYSETHLWRFSNSRSSQTDRYKIPLRHEELLEAEQKELVEMTRSPRSEDHYGSRGPTKYADWNYLQRIRNLEQTTMRCPVCEGTGREMPFHERPVPCIQTFEASGLPDGTRHKTYLLLARYFAYLNMHYDQIVKRLKVIDNKHSIRDPADIEKAAEFGCRHPGPLACTDPVLMKYCRKDKCSSGKSIPNNL